ncbi:hypothetical protein KUTeg_017999 [Tegillarca granosa]|uniref:Proteasome subunit beta n=1 Tax=Tegillarca granosa TaxID=220873 RepID=A0ABQ9EGM4_TEGGR|nr:hypothetical protein KUTeg_017999 [Tegillarca granosa]
MEAIGHAGTCLGILASDGVLLAAERRNINKLLDEVSYSEKIYKLYDDMACSVAGITSDANVLTNELRLIAQRYILQYQEPIPCEQLVSTLCDLKQAYTQFGGKRPFGVSLLYMGWDKHYGFQLYQSDPSGNYGGWKATCIGNNSANAVSMLKQDYKEGETNLQEALALSVKVLSKTLDLSKLTAEKGNCLSGKINITIVIAYAGCCGVFRTKINIELDTLSFFLIGFESLYRNAALQYLTVPQFLFIYLFIY